MVRAGRDHSPALSDGRVRAGGQRARASRPLACTESSLVPVVGPAGKSCRMLLRRRAGDDYFLPLSSDDMNWAWVETGRASSATVR